jgi:hypothetical protein
MLRSVIAIAGAALLLGACETQPQTQAVTAPPPQAATAPSYMVFFDWDRYNLSQQALATIQQAADAYKRGGNPHLTATGHTDTTGSEEYNMALSIRRATAVKNALVQAGVPASAIDTVGRGKHDLLVQTGDGVREPQNRRVEIAGFTTQTSDVFKDPASYCKALSDKYRQLRPSVAEAPVAAAIAQCEAGNYSAGIPVIENALINANVPLPSPGFRWPGRPISS